MSGRFVRRAKPLPSACLLVTPCRVATLLRAQARLYAEALSLYTPHNGTQVYTVAYRSPIEYVVSIIAVALHSTQAKARYHSLWISSRQLL